MQTVKAAELPRNPRECANPLSSLMFCFTMPLLFKGRRKTLEESDLYRPLKEHKSDPLGKKLNRSWEKELHKSQQNNKEPSMLRAVTREFLWSFAIMGFVLFLLEVGLKVSQPIFLGAYVTYFYDAHADHPSDEQTKAYWYAAGVIGCHSINLLLMHPYTMGILHLTMKVRVALRSLIFRKSLRLSKAKANLSATDQVTNLLSNDIGRIDLSFIHFLWIGPVMVITSTYVMYREIGYSALFGIGFMLFFLYMQFFLIKKTSDLDLRTNHYRNERVNKMTEIITDIKVIKMYTWELPFGKMIDFLRTKEINVIRYMNYIRGLLLSFVVFVTRFSIFASLLGYVLLGQLLTAESAFVITAYLNILRSTMYINFPLGLTQYKEMLLSFENIKQYLLLDETNVPEKCVEDQTKETGKINKAFIIQENGNKSIEHFDLNGGRLTNQQDINGPAEITISNLNAKWDTKSTEYTLHDVCLNVKPQSLVAVIGPKGAGKTSLIQAILGELPATSGIVSVNGTVSYASQEPWIFGSTLRQNILCGMPMDEERYRMVLEKCALKYDIDVLPHGDRTIIGGDGGEDTELLTEEQIARVSFARAIYRKASIYLLDDPFKNLETQQSQELFNQCIRDKMRKESIVILVTQQIKFLEQADSIVIMENGRISAVGTYASMCNGGIDFVKLLTVSNEDAEMNEVEKQQQISRKDKKWLERRNSIISKKSLTGSDEEESVEEKKRKEPGWLKALKLYRKYFAYGASYPRIILMLLCFLTAQICASGFDYFLSYWIRKIDHRLHKGDNFNITVDANFSQANNIEPRLNEDMNPVNVYIFGVFTITTVFFALARGFLFLNLTTKSSIGLHDDMYNGVTRAAMHFFDTTPIEQIVKRFSRDLAELDELVPLLMMEVLQLAMTTLGYDFVLSIVNPWFMIFTASLGFIFFLLRVFYMSTGDDLISLDVKIRAQMNSHVSTTLNGISTVRAFGCQKEFTSEFDNYQDIHSTSQYMFLASTRAFGYWIDCVCISYITCITLSFFHFAPASAGSVGLGITQAIGMTNLVQRGIKMSIELEHAMPSMTSVADYGTIESEGELETETEKKPPKEWPQDGQIVFEELSMRYLPDPKSECALKSLNFEIQPSEKVGIVGSTGAGKSALINALYRLSYNDGAVIIDKHDINDLGLHDLRSKISIITKEPVLFSGTVRYNLDPFDEHSDAKLWESLEEVKLKTIISDLPSGLQSEISDGDSNFSSGQRQLLCMARILLRENKILIVDESNDNVDSEFDALLKLTLRNKFKNCTVLTVAQRINTIMDSDKVLVLDNGRVVEFGSPYELLTESEDKIFYDMAKKAENNTFDNLLSVAQLEHEKRLKTKME